MAPRSTQLLFLLVALVALAIPAFATPKETSWPNRIYLHEIEACAPVKALNAIRIAAEEAEGGGGDVASMKAKIFAVAFPFESPGSNALLATLYISLFPNLILGFIPPDLELKSLNVMIGFATGGLLGDTFLNLIPHSFLGEPHPSGDVHIVVVEPRRNVLIGCALFGGFALFFLIDKTMRYLASLTGEDGQEGHSHGHSPSHLAPASSAKSSALESTTAKKELRKRGGVAGSAESEVLVDDIVGAVKEVNPSLRLGAYLNLFADFTHNITDGLAISAAFYASPAIGATTSLACLAHEVPHEIADASILIKSGFTKWQAMGAQFITAVGAFVGTFLGIWIQNLAASSSSHSDESTDLVGAILNSSDGIWGTSIQPSDFTLPMCAGSFLYIGAVTVVPELLAESKSGKQLIKEMLAMGVGISLMAWLSWNE